MLQACLNGARQPGEHPALPVTPVELAADVVAVRAAGAECVHLHVKDESGHDTFDPAALAATLTTAREASPGTPIGVTTGAWAEPSVEKRLAAIASWTELPDFASVNWHEEGAESVAQALIDRDIGVEAGLWTEEAVANWLDSSVAPECLRVLLELPDESDDAQTQTLAARMLATLAEAGNALPVLLHGEGSSTWPALRFAAEHNHHQRIGLEDTLELPDGTAADTNVDLVRAALACNDHPEPSRFSRRSRTAIGKAALLVLLLAAAITVTIVFGPVDIDAFRAQIAQAGLWGPLIFFASYAGLSLLPGAAPLLTVSGGVLFGQWLGAALSLSGALVGSVIAFGIGRSLGRDSVDRLVKGRVARIDALLGDNGLSAVLILRLVPLVPFIAINYASGLTRVRFRDYLIGSAVGMAPGTLAYTALGAYGTEPLGLVLALSGLVVLSVGGSWVARRMQRRRAAQTEGVDNV